MKLCLGDVQFVVRIPRICCWCYLCVSLCSVCCAGEDTRPADLSDFDTGSFEKSVYNCWATTRVQAVIAVQRWTLWLLAQMPSSAKSGGFLSSLIPGRQDPEGQRETVMNTFKAVLLHRLDVCRTIEDRKDVSDWPRQ